MLTLADDSYPWRIRDRLAQDASPVLFVTGDRSILEAGGVAIVGSRDVDAVAAELTEAVASAAARGGQVVCPAAHVASTRSR